MQWEIFPPISRPQVSWGVRWRRFSRLMTFARSAALACLVLWGLDAAVWARPIPAALGWALGLLRIALFAALAVAAVRQGRRWSAAPIAFGVASLILLAPFIVGVLSGDFAARHVGPAFVFAFLAVWLAIALSTVVLATGIALVWHRRRVRTVPLGAI